MKKILVAVAGLATAAVLAACSSGTTAANVQPAAANVPVSSDSPSPTTTTTPPPPPVTTTTPPSTTSSKPKTTTSKPKTTTPTPAANNGTPCPTVTTGACVSISAKKAWLIQNGKVVYGPVPVTTGRSGYPTPTGTFHVLYKEKMHYSKEFDNAEMPNSVFFYPGDAFHQGSLSTPSHGCVHLSAAASLKFFNTLQVGQTVQVVK